jgi:hypothetical protein
MLVGVMTSLPVIHLSLSLKGKSNGIRGMFFCKLPLRPQIGKDIQTSPDYSLARCSLDFGENYQWELFRPSQYTPRHWLVKSMMVQLVKQMDQEKEKLDHLVKDLRREKLEQSYYKSEVLWVVKPE